MSEVRNLEPAKKPENADIYTILRADINSLRLKPGMLFSIKDICEQYGVGRTPMRDALIRLVQEGLVTSLPQRGTMISKLDLKRIENERFIRKAIERDVMKDFLAGFSPSVILRMEDSIEKQRECIKSKDFREFLAEDDEFHGLFFEEVGRMQCKEVVDRECSNYSRLRLLSLMADEGAALSNIVKEHAEMVGAASVRNLDQLMYWFDIHLDRVCTQQYKLIRQYPDLFENPPEQDRRLNTDLQRDFLLTLRSRGNG